MDDEDRRRHFEETARELVEPLRRFLARRTDPATADDVLADTLLVCWRRVDQIPGDPLPWAYGVARNCLANAERGERRQRRLAARVASVAPPETVPDPADEHAGGPGEEAVRQALADLRPADAELLRLWAWEQLAPGEIATVLGVTPNAASIRLHRARRQLGDRLRKMERAAGHEESREGRRP